MDLSAGRLSGNTKQHILQQIVQKERKKYPQKPCKVCSSKKKRMYVNSIYMVSLHKGEYFTKYHTRKKH